MDNTTRIEKIETELGRIKKINRGLLALVAGALALLALGAANEQQQPAELKAKKIILEDASGKERGVFSTGEKGVELKLLGAEGKPQLVLYAEDAGPGLYLADLNGAERIGIRARGTDAQVTVSDSAARQRLQMLVRNEQPSLALSDAAGRERITLKTENTDPLVSITDTNGKLRLRLGMRDDFPNLTLSGSGGEPFWAAIPDKYKE